VKPFAVWLGAVAVVFGVVAGGYHMMRQGDPDRVFVVVDTAFDMDEVWRQVPGVLDGLDNDRYTEYALATDKGSVHGWQSELRLNSTTPYAPRNLTAITAYPEVAEASKLILVTNAAPGEIAGLSGWEIVRLEG
jgi:hypothetical protein